MINLLEETIEILRSNCKTPKDVLWVGNTEFWFNTKATWEDFEELANFTYDNGYGKIEIVTDLVIVGDGWWLERSEYDGSEWWSFKTVLTSSSEFTNSLVISSNEGEDIIIVVPKPKTEDDMLRRLNEEVYVVLNDETNNTKDAIHIKIKDYLTLIEWFYEKYKLLF